MSTDNHVYTRDEINEILKTNDIAVMRAIVHLFRLQTDDEVASTMTKHQNAMGFCAADAKAGTRMARWLLGLNDNNVQRYPMKDLRHPLAARVFGRYTQNGGTVMDRARKIALKHSAQIVAIANGDLQG